MLLQSFDRLGQSALDHSKDKFLVQTCIVDADFAMDFASFVTVVQGAKSVDIPEDVEFRDHTVAAKGHQGLQHGLGN